MRASAGLKSLIKRSPLSRYLCGRDDFVRHRAAARLLGRDVETALDVGGEGLLAMFRRDVKFTTANVKKADAVASAERLPFRDNSFDAVVCIDTLEHLPRGIRTAAVAEMVRVARKRVVVAAPLGTEGHMAFERRLLEELVRAGAADTGYLAEHVRHGLPTPEDIDRLRRAFGGEVWYEGDYRHAGGVASGNRCLALVLGAWDNAADDLSPNSNLSRKPHRHTNRFYLTIDPAKTTQRK
ncbi:MAG TPA: hypothetical protein DDW31_07625 [candidate division Zixibacteria bacterium]|nr:hypothetical protein [candidate division Zixibacteria bacterium]